MNVAHEVELLVQEIKRLGSPGKLISLNDFQGQIRLQILGSQAPVCWVRDGPLKSMFSWPGRGFCLMCWRVYLNQLICHHWKLSLVSHTLKTTHIRGNEYQLSLLQFLTNFLFTNRINELLKDQLGKFPSHYKICIY